MRDQRSAYLSCIERVAAADRRQRFESAEVFQRIKHIVIPSNEQNLNRLAATIQ